MTRFKPHATYDHDADAIYVYLARGEVARSTILDDLRIIDHSADGRVLGIEFLGVGGGIDLSDVPYGETVERLIGELNLGIRIFA